MVRWSDADANGHLRNTAYPEFANDTRVALLASFGYPWTRFQSLHLGPVLFREEIEYRREAAIGEEVLVDALCAGIAPDASRWSIRHRLWKADGTEMAAGHGGGLVHRPGGAPRRGAARGPGRGLSLHAAERALRRAAGDPQALAGRRGVYRSRTGAERAARPGSSALGMTPR